MSRMLFIIVLIVVSYMTIPVCLFAQGICGEQQLQITLELQTDDYAYETSWEIKDRNGTVYAQSDEDLTNDTLYTIDICVPRQECMQFVIRDVFSDGLFPPGYYRLSVDGVLIAEGGAFAAEEVVEFNCLAGQSCSNAIPVTEGAYRVPQLEYWYIFTPDSSGRFDISTCGAACDTRLYVYTSCNPNAVNDDHEGSDFYNDHSEVCAENAVLTGLFQRDRTYYIRVGQTENSCIAATDIPLSIRYAGAVIGCTDPNSCNYHPLATVDDGTCIPQGSTDCPDAADLTIREDVLRSSLRLDSIENEDGCLIREGCLTGYGKRHILRFDTQIENIGELDYIIGRQTDALGLFSYDNCHQHYHYEGYAEYVLYDQQSNPLPASFKNGFCVLDLNCTSSGRHTYSCDYMGISAGCLDIYHSDLECQWIDITDLPAGDYTFVTRVNWNNRPDLTGRVEKNMDNNWAQVCFRLQRNGAQISVQQQSNCATYTDCNGTLFGNAVPDCNGICGGTALSGDINNDSRQDMADVETYLDEIIEETAAAPCYDLNADGHIDIYDAMLLSDCLRYSEGHIHEGGTLHEHCNFPAGINNTNEAALLSIIAIDPVAGTIDIGISNPQSALTGFQFGITGAQIASVRSLVPSDQYAPILRADPTGQYILGMSSDGQALPKSAEVQPLLRIGILHLQADSVCISRVDALVNQRYEQIQGAIDIGCVTDFATTTSNIRTDAGLQISPNPFQNSTLIQFADTTQQYLQLEVLDINGQLISRHQITSNALKIDTQHWSSGLYFYSVQTKYRVYVGKLGVKL